MTSETETPTHEVDRDIYGMPAFVTLPTSDMTASRSWYASLGFVELAVMPPGADAPTLVHLRRYRYQDILLAPTEGPVRAGDARTAFTHTGPLDELDDIAAAARDHGGGHVEGPHQTAWYSVDLVAHDPDGHVVVLTARSTQPPPREWSDAVRASVQT